MQFKPKRISLILLNIESKNSVLLWDGTSRDTQISIFSSRSIWRAWGPFEHLFAESRILPNIKKTERRTSNRVSIDCAVNLSLIDMHSQEGYFRTKTAYWILSLRLEVDAVPVVLE